jgi:hypothetical protein
MKRCWQCAEEIQDAAIMCRFCQAKQHIANPNASAPATSSQLSNRQVLWLIGGLAFAGIALSVHAKLKPEQYAKPAEAVASIPKPTPSATISEAAPASKWTYQEYSDPMHGTKSNHAKITSENEADLDFPYGRQSASIELRRDPRLGLDVMFVVAEGQIMCRTYDDTYVSVKFDAGPVQRFRCTDASAGSSNVVFLGSASSFIAKLKESKSVMLEAEFYRSGRRQFTFETAGLEWK